MADTTPIPVGLADSNPLMLGALSDVLDRDPRFSLVASCKTSEVFLDLAAHATIRIGIIDWAIPDLGGERLLTTLRARPDPPRIVVYSHDPGTDAARRAMAAGAAGFCARSEPPERLLDIVAEVAAGRMVFPFVDVRELRRDPIETLTRRERALLDLLAKGLSNKAMADELGISLNTVKYHLKGIYEKLAVNSRTQAIALYYAAPSTRTADDEDP